MNESKTVTIRGTKYKMNLVASTGWVFVYSNKARRTYPVAKLVDGELSTIHPDEALRYASNAELVQAWLAN